MTSERMLDWVDGLGQDVIRRAARRAPAGLSERLEEEWLADFLERPGQFSRLRFAVGCCWATSVIAYNHRIAAVPVTGSASAQVNSFGLVQNNTPMVSRRTMTFLLVACLHAAALYALLVTVTKEVVHAPAPPLQNHVITEHRPVDVTSSLGPTIRDPVPIPQPPIDMPPIESESTEGAAVRVDDMSRNTAPTLTTTVNRVRGGPGAGFPIAEDFYPSGALFRGEQGIATVQACVDGMGRLISNPTLIQSTGSSRLDEAALRLAKAGSGHYRASTEDGHPVNSCYPFRIRFDLRN